VWGMWVEHMRNKKKAKSFHLRSEKVFFGHVVKSTP